ncbi:hypothetical protein [Streptosporangium lutulentum]|uniref:Uncharacterized protein n=1 Tax=Streptosporangium lutulentum TaxID=1461250 RepID=A0ABT9QJ73_9ACTN|nr:hypothetical protein [Streptosporangium lutulentum]MDP9846749.1 hypothetical protein [Streptosporangium lutulentum]
MVTLFAFMAVTLTAAGALRWSGEVRPHRITAFSRRQALIVTPAAEPVVRDYLRITRMWRSAGLVAGIAFPTVGTGGFGSFAFAPSDVVAAVLATRSRSAHVLATGCAVVALDGLLPDSFPLPGGGSLPAGLLGAAVAIAALIVGTQPWAINVTTAAPTPP